MIRITLGLGLLAGLLTAALAADADTPKPTAPPEPEGMVRLFKGDDTTGWDGDSRLEPA